MDASGRISISVYNLVGERVRHIADENAAQGTTFGYVWNGTNDSGDFVGNGVYIIMMKSPKGVTLKKVIILK